MRLPGYWRVRSARRVDGGLQYELELRTWHPSWWAVCWRESVEFVRARYVEHGVALVFAFFLALYLCAVILAKTVRFGSEVIR